jgi:ABC-2 type transport system ATP-binding protein
VGRGRAPDVAARLLHDLPVLDLTIEDPPIEDVIESVFAQGSEATERDAIEVTG